MMRFAAEAARYLPEYEVLEIHNERKADAPSGTALTTLDMMEMQRRVPSTGAANNTESVPGCRGGAYGGSRVHSLVCLGLLPFRKCSLADRGNCCPFAMTRPAGNVSTPVWHWLCERLES